MNFIKNLKWRYATKYFDPLKKVNENQLTVIKEAIQLSASSYGLQLYKIIIIKNPILKETLKEASWGQNQIADASHVFVFCRYKKITNLDVDIFIDLSLKSQNLNGTELVSYSNFIKDKINEM